MDTSAPQAANVYDTPWSDKQPEIHFLPKAKMNIFTQAEMDDTATGIGMVHLGSAGQPYAFMHKVAGQQDIAERTNRAWVWICQHCISHLRPFAQASAIL